MIAAKIQDVWSTRPLIVLLDSGSTHCIIHQQVLPAGATPTKASLQKTMTANGTFDTSQQVQL